MPVTLTYPGVYVEEVPSGVRTITGVATSITGFIGRARRGPVNQAVTIHNFGDFERIFGGLWQESSLGFAVRDFYLNGGGRAIIVRLFHSNEGETHSKTFAVGGLSLVAANEGSWGDQLRVNVNQTDIPQAVADQMGLALADLFNLEITDKGTGISERFLNLTVKDSTRRIDQVLKNQSTLLNYTEPYPDPPPTLAIDPVSKVETDGMSTAEKDLSDARAALLLVQAAGEPDTTAEEAAVTSAIDALGVAAGALNTTDGGALAMADFLPPGGEATKEGLHALEQVDLFNMVCIPPYRGGNADVDVPLMSAAASYCEKRRAMLLVDPPSTWTTKAHAVTGIGAEPDEIGTRSKNAALFFPRLRQPNPLRDNQIETFAPCGAVAGIFARTDSQRGVWKAPAGLAATLNGVPQLSVNLTDDENGELNPLGVNCLRTRPAAGRVVWGSRTLQGDDRLASEWKYVPVRRTALFLEESLYRGTQWVVFEPNDEPLWAQIRLNIGAFMQNLFRQGAFQGKTPREAYLVKVDSETTTQNDINLGIVNIVVGFAPLKPAEFVVLKIQQLAGQIEA